MIEKNCTFPCSLCGAPLAIRETKKGKPHLICNSCGVQMFIRYAEGIHRLEQLLAEAQNVDIRKLLSILAKRYKKTCPKCQHGFWIEEKLIRTSSWDGKLIGYECPGCGALVKVEEPKK